MEWRLSGSSMETGRPIRNGPEERHGMVSLVEIAIFSRVYFENRAKRI